MSAGVSSFPPDRSQWKGAEGCSTANAATRIGERLLAGLLTEAGFDPLPTHSTTRPGFVSDTEEEVEEKLLFAGFDISSTGSGYCLLSADGVILDHSTWQSKGTESERLSSLGWWADVIAGGVRNEVGPDGIVCLSMEGPFLRGGGYRPLLRSQGAVMSRFLGDWQTYQPMTVKALAAQVSGIATIGSGVGKESMIAAARVRWGDEEFRLLDDHADPYKALGDLADAAWVAETDRLRVTGAMDGR